MFVKLTGPMGAGKTTLVSQMLLNWNIQGNGSPTFNLRNDYSTESMKIIHLDFYRLKANDSAWDVLPDDEDYSESVIIAEWADKIPAGLLANFSRVAGVSIAVSPDGRRTFEVQGLS